MVEIDKRYLDPVGISSIPLTVLGFVVGLALSLRSSTAYERYVSRLSSLLSLAHHYKDTLKDENSGLNCCNPLERWLVSYGCIPLKVKGSKERRIS